MTKFRELMKVVEKKAAAYLPSNRRVSGQSRCLTDAHIAATEYTMDFVGSSIGDDSSKAPNYKQSLVKQILDDKIISVMRGSLRVNKALLEEARNSFGVYHTNEISSVEAQTHMREKITDGPYNGGILASAGPSNVVYAHKDYIIANPDGTPCKKPSLVDVISVSSPMLTINRQKKPSEDYNKYTNNGLLDTVAYKAEMMKRTKLVLDTVVARGDNILVVPGVGDFVSGLIDAEKMKAREVIAECYRDLLGTAEYDGKITGITFCLPDDGNYNAFVDILKRNNSLGGVVTFISRNDFSSVAREIEKSVKRQGLKVAIINPDHPTQPPGNGWKLDRNGKDGAQALEETLFSTLAFATAVCTDVNRSKIMDPQNYHSFSSPRSPMQGRNSIGYKSAAAAAAGLGRSSRGAGGSGGYSNSAAAAADENNKLTQISQDIFSITGIQARVEVLDIEFGANTKAVRKTVIALDSQYDAKVMAKLLLEKDIGSISKPGSAKNPTKLDDSNKRYIILDEDDISRLNQSATQHQSQSGFSRGSHGGGSGGYSNSAAAAAAASSSQTSSHRHYAGSGSSSRGAGGSGGYSNSAAAAADENNKLTQISQDIFSITGIQARVEDLDIEFEANTQAVRKTVIALDSQYDAKVMAKLLLEKGIGSISKPGSAKNPTSFNDPEKWYIILDEGDIPELNKIATKHQSQSGLRRGSRGGDYGAAASSTSSRHHYSGLGGSNSGTYGGGGFSSAAAAAAATSSSQFLSRRHHSARLSGGNGGAFGGGGGGNSSDDETFVQRLSSKDSQCNNIAKIIFTQARAKVHVSYDIDENMLIRPNNPLAGQRLGALLSECRIDCVKLAGETGSFYKLEGDDIIKLLEIGNLQEGRGR